MSGDLDFDKTIALIDKKLLATGDRNDQIPQWTRIEEPALTAPVAKRCMAPDAKWIQLGFRFNGTSSEDAQLLRLTDMILANPKAGLIDINLKQAQKVIEPTSYVDYLNDYSIHTFSARRSVKVSRWSRFATWCLNRLSMLKRRVWRWLIEAVINDLKKSETVDRV